MKVPTASITFINQKFSYKEILEDSSILDDFEPELRDYLSVIREWFSDRQKFEFQTSGSTSKPKKIVFERSQIIDSASRTIRFFKLKKGDQIVCCLHPGFVAGYMMIIRGIVGELDITILPAEANPLKHLAHNPVLEFMSLVPYQLDRIITESPKKLANVKNVLVGGAAVSKSLEQRCLQIPSQIMHSYGMTETLTHVAIRNVNGPKRSKTYSALPDISFDVDERSCLVVNDQRLKIDNMPTNDMVELFNNQSFKWLGRIDHVINSGGVKIQIESLEEDIRSILSSNDMASNLCVVSVESESLTNEVVLLIENASDVNVNEILLLLKSQLPRHLVPRKLVPVSQLIRTRSGKIDRPGNLEQHIMKIAENEQPGKI